MILHYLWVLPQQQRYFLEINVEDPFRACWVGTTNSSSHFFFFFAAGWWCMTLVWTLVCSWTWWRVRRDNNFISTCDTLDLQHHAIPTSNSSRHLQQSIVSACYKNWDQYQEDSSFGEPLRPCSDCHSREHDFDPALLGGILIPLEECHYFDITCAGFRSRGWGPEAPPTH